MEASFDLDALHIAADPAAPPSASVAEDPAEPVAASPIQDVDATLSAMNDRHVTVLLGERAMDDNSWDPVDKQIAAGVEYDATDPQTGHGYEFGLTYSRDDDDVGATDVDGNTFDVYGGYRHTFRLDEPKLHPYLSGGLALIRAEVERDGPGPDTSDDDHSAGAYIRAGIGFDLNETTRLGLDYRHMFLTDIDIGGISDADFDQIMVTLGFAL